MKQIKDKISNKTLSSDDIDIITQKLEEIIKKKNKGYANFSEDDIKQLRVLKFLLKLQEKSTGTVTFTIQDDRYERIKNILDELILNKIITEPITALGGYVQFQIFDRVRYRDYIYKLIQLIIDKLPQDDYLTLLKRVDPNNPYIAGIIVTVIGGVILYLISKYLGWIS